MTWSIALAFLLGISVLPLGYVAIEFAKQMRSLWRGLDYYEQPENAGSLTWFGKGAHRVMRMLRRKP